MGDDCEQHTRNVKFSFEASEEIKQAEEHSTGNDVNNQFVGLNNEIQHNPEDDANKSQGAHGIEPSILWREVYFISHEFIPKCKQLSHSLFPSFPEITS